jgi:(p)ppGpp synthase/HD superfamily hydrolase
LNTIKKTTLFAKKAHEGQVRKYTNDPYIKHPLAVSMILRQNHHETTVEMIQAAILHDTVEDTDVTLEDIEQNFGLEVKELVFWLTDVSKPEMGNRAFRKSLDRKHTADAPVEAQVIKCADLLHNSISIIKHDKDFAKVFIKEKRLLLDSMKEETKKTDMWKNANKTCLNYYRTKR